MRQAITGQDHLSLVSSVGFCRALRHQATLSTPSSQPFLFLRILPSRSQTQASLRLTFLRLINPPGARVATTPGDASAPPPRTPPPHIARSRWGSLSLEVTPYFRRMKSRQAEVNDTRTRPRGWGAAWRSLSATPLLLVRGLRTELGVVTPLAF